MFARHPSRWDDICGARVVPRLIAGICACRSNCPEIFDQTPCCPACSTQKGLHPWTPRIHLWAAQWRTSLTLEIFNRLGRVSSYAKRGRRPEVERCPILIRSAQHQIGIEEEGEHGFPRRTPQPSCSMQLFVLL